MAGRQLAAFLLPVVAALPSTARTGQQVFYSGAEYTYDGSAWSTGPTPAASSSVSTARVVLTIPSPRREFLGTVNVNGLAVSERVQAWIGHGATSPKAADEFEMDVLDVWACVYTPGVLTLRLTSRTGLVTGVFPINYQRG